MQNKMSIKLEEYIPLKIIFDRAEEPVDYISYSKETTSSLEFAVGMKSKQILRITLLLSKEYLVVKDKLVLDNFEEGNLILANNNVNCKYFKTFLYSDGAKIVVSNKNSYKYIKMDRIRFGLSDTNDITEICVCDMNACELEHLKNELELQ